MEGGNGGNGSPPELSPNSKSLSGENSVGIREGERSPESPGSGAKQGHRLVRYILPDVKLDGHWGVVISHGEEAVTVTKSRGGGDESVILQLVPGSLRSRDNGSGTDGGTIPESQVQVEVEKALSSNDDDGSKVIRKEHDEAEGQGHPKTSKDEVVIKGINPPTHSAPGTVVVGPEILQMPEVDGGQMAQKNLVSDIVPQSSAPRDNGSGTDGEKVPESQVQVGVEEALCSNDDERLKVIRKEHDKPPDEQGQGPSETIKDEVVIKGINPPTTQSPPGTVVVGPRSSNHLLEILPMPEVDGGKVAEKNLVLDQNQNVSIPDMRRRKKEGRRRSVGAQPMNRAHVEESIRRVIQHALSSPDDPRKSEDPTSKFTTAPPKKLPKKMTNGLQRKSSKNQKSDAKAGRTKETASIQIDNSNLNKKRKGRCHSNNDMTSISPRDIAPARKCNLPITAFKSRKRKGAREGRSRLPEKRQSVQKMKLRPRANRATEVVKRTEATRTRDRLTRSVPTAVLEQQVNSTDAVKIEENFMLSWGLGQRTKPKKRKKTISPPSSSQIARRRHRRSHGCSHTEQPGSSRMSNRSEKIQNIQIVPQSSTPRNNASGTDGEKVPESQAQVRVEETLCSNDDDGSKVIRKASETTKDEVAIKGINPPTAQSPRGTVVVGPANHLAAILQIPEVNGGGQMAAKNLVVDKNQNVPIPDMRRRKKEGRHRSAGAQPMNRAHVEESIRRVIQYALSSADENRKSEDPIARFSTASPRRLPNKMNNGLQRRSLKNRKRGARAGRTKEMDSSKIDNSDLNKKRKRRCHSKKDMTSISPRDIAPARDKCNLPIAAFKDMESRKRKGPRGGRSRLPEKRQPVHKMNLRPHTTEEVKRTEGTRDRPTRFVPTAVLEQQVNSTDAVKIEENFLLAWGLRQGMKPKKRNKTTPSASSSQMAQRPHRRSRGNTEQPGSSRGSNQRMQNQLERIMHSKYDVNEENIVRGRRRRIGATEPLSNWLWVYRQKRRLYRTNTPYESQKKYRNEDLKKSRNAVQPGNKCPYCPVVFAVDAHLNQHLLTHKEQYLTVSKEESSDLIETSGKNFEEVLGELPEEKCC